MQKRGPSDPEQQEAQVKQRGGFGHLPPLMAAQVWKFSTAASINHCPLLELLAEMVLLCAMARHSSIESGSTVGLARKTLAMAG